MDINSKGLLHVDIKSDGSELLIIPGRDNQAPFVVLTDYSKEFFSKEFNEEALDAVVMLADKLYNNDTFNISLPTLKQMDIVFNNINNSTIASAFNISASYWARDAETGEKFVKCMKTGEIMKGSKNMRANTMVIKTLRV